MREEIDFIRDLLDKQLVDSEDTRMGRADGVVMIVDDEGPPRIDHLELGFAVLARRIHPRVRSGCRHCASGGVRGGARGKSCLGRR